MRIFLGATSVLLLLMGGCSTVSVQQQAIGADGVPGALAEVPGLPFYAVRYVEVHTLVCQQPWLEATLTVEQQQPAVDGKPPSWQVVQTYSRRVGVENRPALDRIAQTIISDQANVQAKVDQLLTIPAVESDALQQLPMALVGRVAEQRRVVDATTRYYLNAPLPWFGSSSLAPEFVDGLLSKLTASAETGLAEGFKALNPLREFLTGKSLATDPEADKLVTNAVVKAGKTPGANDRRVSLVVREAGYVYRVSVDKPAQDWTCNWRNVSANRFVRTPWAAEAEAAQKPPAPAAAGPQIGLTGTITLPKASTTAP
ncbi:MAG: hypothetical protein IV093_10110 [Rubrivivax sp.]|nr:hypothetical protein [Rubrivivax sp.]